MKVIKYKILGYTGVWNPETEEVEQKECLAGIECQYTEAAYQKALAESYNGEVTVEEVEDEETTTEPTIDQRVSDLEETTVQQGEILNILLSGETGESV